MRLKKLEIYGFKSFADKTVMVFDDGITGVVGPNGSGKSNISDAVRWVLGEQSAKSLRGAKMEDVIFGGTEKRRALNYCEVSLVFDNEDGSLPIDFAEVQVTRRVYRSGDSEYSINKSPCRLKDVIDLFRDTGIGKEGYSIIGQGRIDNILSIKSEDRRNVFEEAAGITKFKARRSEAQRRMEHTSQNLERIGDILEEIEKRLPGLEQQAKTAKQYTQLMQELKVLEANVFLSRHRQLQDDIAKSETQLATDQASAQALEQEREELSGRSALEEDEQNTLDALLRQLNETLIELTRAAQIHQGEAGILKERIESSKNELERLAKEDASAGSDEELARMQIQAEEENIKRLLHELNAFTARMAEQEAKVQAAEQQVFALEEENERTKEQMIASFGRLTDVKATTARLTATKESVERQLASLNESTQGQTNALAAAQNEAQQAQEQMDQACAKLEEYKQASASLSGKQAALLSQVSQEEDAISKISGALLQGQSRLKMLEQMRRDYDGYQNSVKEVLKRFANDPAIDGVVASLITVPKELERAIEMALGGAMQNIVCQREEDAKRMIDVLRQNRLGRATFLPLSAVRPRTLAPNERDALNTPGCIGVASELIKYDEKYKNIIENLLGRTVIARDLDSGIHIQRKGRHAFRLVTLEGDMMHSGGSMTGGSTQSRTTSLLSRQREIEEHQQAVARLEARLAEGKAQLARTKDAQAQLAQELKATNALVHEGDLDVLRASAALDSARQSLAQCKERMQSVSLEKERMLDSIKEITDELQRIQRAAGEAETASTTTQQDIAQRNEVIRQARDALEVCRDELAALGLERAAAEAKLDTARREMQRGERSVEQMGQTKLVRERAKTGLALRIENDQNALAAAEQLAQNAQAELETTKQAHDEAQQKRNLCQQRLKALNERSESVRSQIESLRDGIHRAQLRLERWRDEFAQIQDRLWERHELSFALAKELYDESIDIKAAKGRSDSIRASIRQMGMVNLAAVQEYDENKERFDGLDKQRKDLETAQRDLEKIIADLTKEMEVLFRSQFSLINDNFGKTFKKLFEGGTAMLRLQDEKDCLNCGIDIIAQPPGKKLQLLSLLSGGERALTAIALLFSMLTIRPSPFCILDEIEAALDEANVVGFAKYLQEYATDTQFIVITHRKGTMEHCDSLYGIAMEEKGISRMVSVQLSEIDQENLEEPA